MVLKKLVVGLACIGMVLFGTVPVHAANDADVPHVHIYEGTGTQFSAFTGDYDVGTHTVVTMEEYKCSICGKKSSIEVSRRDEAHSPVFTSASSGHTIPEYHDFKGKCACGFTTITIKYCSGC